MLTSTDHDEEIDNHTQNTGCSYLYIPFISYMKMNWNLLYTSILVFEHYFIKRVYCCLVHKVFVSTKYYRI